MSGSAVPSGYIEAYSRIGQNIAGIGENLGKGIAEAVAGYAKGAADMDAQRAINEQNAAVWNDEMVKLYGADSKEYQDWKRQAEKASTMGLSQLKAWNATNMGRGETIKRQLEIEQVATINQRNRILGARGAIAATGVPDQDVGEIKTSTYTFKDVKEIDDVEKELESKWQALLARAQSEGRDPRDPAYATELEALTGTLRSVREARNKVNERVNSKTVRKSNADAIAGVAEMVADAEAQATAPATADAVAEAAGKGGTTKVEEPKPPAEDTVDRSKQVAETPLGYPVFIMRKKDGTSSFFVEGQGEITNESAKKMGLDVDKLPTRQFVDDSQPTKQKVPATEQKRNDMLRDWAQRTYKVLEGTPLEGVYDAPDSTDIWEASGSDSSRRMRTDPKGEMQASADKFYKSAQAMQTAAERTLAAIEEAERNGTVGRMFLQSTTEPLVAEGDTGSTRGINVKKFGLVDSTKVGSYKENLLLNTPEKVAEAKAELKRQIAGIRTGVNVFNARFKELEFPEGGGATVRDVEVGRGTPKKEGAAVLEAAATAAAAGKAKTTTRADLTIPFKEAVGKLNNGEVVEFNPFDEDGNLTPMMRVLAAANPDLQLREGGAFNYDAAGSALARMFNANVSIEDGKVVLRPVEAEPVTVEATDINSARTYDEAQRIARNNYVIDFLKQRGITPTPENIEFVMNGGLSGGRKVEWTSQGVFAAAPEISAKDRLEIQKLQLGLQQAEQSLANSKLEGVAKLAELQSGVFGRDAVINADGSVSAKPMLMNPNTYAQDPSKGVFVRSVGILPPKQAEEYRTAIGSANATIDRLKISLPARLKQIGEQLSIQDGKPVTFLRPDGSIDGAALANDERALREYLGEVFSVVREMGKGLGPLAGNDYVFLFAQVGVPVTWQEIVDGDGSFVDRLISGGIKVHAQSNPDYFNNALTSIENQMRGKMLALNELSNGKLQVAFGNKVTDREGNVRPFDDNIRDSIVSEITAASANTENRGGKKAPTSQMGLFAHMYLNPAEYTVAGKKYFNTPEEAMRGAIRQIAVQTGYPEEYVARTLEYLRQSGNATPAPKAPASK